MTEPASKQQYCPYRLLRGRIDIPHSVYPVWRPSPGSLPRFCDREVGKWITWCTHYWSGSRSQLSDRIEDGLIELVQLSSLQFPVEYLECITASPPEVEVILVVGHRVLDRRESEVRLHRVIENVPESNVVSRALVEPKGQWFRVGGKYRSVSKPFYPLLLSTACSLPVQMYKRSMRQWQVAWLRTDLEKIGCRTVRNVGRIAQKRSTVRGEKSRLRQR
jgi:hypothetical protein